MSANRSKAPLLRLAALLAVSLTLNPPVSAASVPVLPGVYKNVQFHAETGDVLGMAVEIRDRPSPSIVVTVCEGECSGGKAWPLRWQGGSFRFATCEALRDEKGQALPCRSMRYSGRVLPVGRLAVMMAGQPLTRQILRRVAQPKPGEVERLACQAAAC